MARPASRPEPDELEALDEEIPLDPEAVERRYRLERARRRARARHEQEKAVARVRFFGVLLVLVGAAAVLVLLTWDQVQRLFGL